MLLSVTHRPLIGESLSAAVTGDDVRYMQGPLHVVLSFCGAIMLLCNILCGAMVLVTDRYMDTDIVLQRDGYPVQREAMVLG